MVKAIAAVVMVLLMAGGVLAAEQNFAPTDYVFNKALNRWERPGAQPQDAQSSSADGASSSGSAGGSGSSAGSSGGNR